MKTLHDKDINLCVYTFGKSGCQLLQYRLVTLEGLGNQRPFDIPVYLCTVKCIAIHFAISAIEHSIIPAGKNIYKI